jgi:hypothetical protein
LHVIGSSTALEYVANGNGGKAGYSDRVTVTNTGDITTGGAGTGQGSYGILAQSIGGGGGDGGMSIAGGISGANGVSLGIGGNGGTASDSGVVTVINSSAIGTLGAHSHALFAQSVGGGGGSGRVHALNTTARQYSFSTPSRKPTN